MTTVAIPTLETERLVLRAVRPEDHGAFTAYYADPESRFTGGPGDAIHAWRAMAIYMGHWVLRGFGQWAIEDKATGRFCGAAGAYLPFDWPENELGWWLVPDARGRGIITEAVARARHYYYEECGWTTAVSYIDPENEPSKRVALRLGATLEGTIVLRNEVSEVYRHPSPEAIGIAPGKDAA